MLVIYKLTNKEEIPIESKIVAFYISKFNDENKSSINGYRATIR